MGLELIISKQIVQMIKDSDRVIKSVDTMKEKLINESLKVLEKSGIDPASLPFDPISVLKGNIPDPNSLLSPENICSIPPIARDKVLPAIRAIDSSKALLSNVVENTNKLKSTLIDIQTPLTGIQTAGESASNIVNSISNVVKIIKSIPIPTAFGAPAVALPVKVLTILSSTLIRLDKIVVIGKGTVSFVAPMIRSVSGALNGAIGAVGSLELAIAPALSMLTLTKSVLELGPQCPDVTQADIDLINQDVAQDLNSALLSSGDSSLLDVNISNETELIESFPFVYLGFTLELVNNPRNASFSINPNTGLEERGVEFPFPSRKIRATRDFEANPDDRGGSIFVRTKFNTPLAEIILFNDPGGQGRYSYSTSVSILVKEMKFKLDNYMKGVKSLALPELLAGTSNSDVRGVSNPNPNPQVFRPPADIPINGSDDPPSPTGSVDPPLPPAYYFNDPNTLTEVTPLSTTIQGTFTVVRPVKVKMSTFGGNWPLDGESEGFLRIYKQAIPGYSYVIEQQFAEMQQTITTQNNPQGYYNNNPQEYINIDPGYANGSVVSNIGIFKYELELTSYIGPSDGGAGNFANFEIEAQ